MVPITILDEDRFFDPDPTIRKIARGLYEGVKDLPIISSHGHTDPRWFAENQPFPDPAELIVISDHYIFRMLYSRGIPLGSLGIPTVDGSRVETDGRKIWQPDRAAICLMGFHNHLVYNDPGLVDNLTCKFRYCLSPVMPIYQERPGDFIREQSIH